jgi:hypothetical protein
MSAFTIQRSTSQHVGASRSVASRTDIAVVAPARRHPTLHELETDLQWITWSAAATGLSTTEARGLAALPTTVWLAGPSELAKSRHGLLPHPVRWSGSTLVVVADVDQVIEMSWTTRAFGQRRSGTVRLHLSDTEPIARVMTSVKSDDLLTAGAAGNTLDVRVAPMTSRAISAEITRLRGRAKMARWAIHDRLQPWLRRSLTAAHRSVGAELKLYRVLDDLALDDLFNEIHLGTTGRVGLIDKVIDRLSGPSSRPNVDAARYIATTFRRDAELALRRRIDDPRWVGPALRRYAADHPELEGCELVERFNLSGCLSERIGMDRAMRALMPAVQPVIVDVPLDLIAPTTDLVDDSWMGVAS